MNLSTSPNDSTPTPQTKTPTTVGIARYPDSWEDAMARAVVHAVTLGFWHEAASRDDLLSLVRRLAHDAVERHGGEDHDLGVADDIAARAHVLLRMASTDPSEPGVTAHIAERSA